MKFSEIIDLAKAGYKPSDIKELMQLQDPEETKPVAKPEAKGSEGKVKEEDPVDYKKLYEEEKKLREELQDKNSKEPIDPEPLKIDEVIKSVKRSIS